MTYTPRPSLRADASADAAQIASRATPAVNDVAPAWLAQMCEPRHALTREHALARDARWGDAVSLNVRLEAQARVASANSRMEATGAVDA